MNRGFTLIEVAVAMALSAIIVVPAATMLLNIQKSTVESDRALRATNLAQSLMERFVRNAAAPSATPSTTVDDDFSYQVRLNPVGGTDATATAQLDLFIGRGATPYCSLVSVVRRQK